MLLKHEDLTRIQTPTFKVKKNKKQEWPFETVSPVLWELRQENPYTFMTSSLAPGSARNSVSTNTVEIGRIGHLVFPLDL